MQAPPGGLLMRRRPVPGAPRWDLPMRERPRSHAGLRHEAETAWLAVSALRGREDRFCGTHREPDAARAGPLPGHGAVGDDAAPTPVRRVLVAAGHGGDNPDWPLIVRGATAAGGHSWRPQLRPKRRARTPSPISFPQPIRTSASRHYLTTLPDPSTVAHAVAAIDGPALPYPMLKAGAGWLARFAEAYRFSVLLRQDLAAKPVAG